MELRRQFFKIEEVTKKRSCDKIKVKKKELALTSSNVAVLRTVALHTSKWPNAC